MATGTAAAASSYSYTTTCAHQPAAAHRPTEVSDTDSEPGPLYGDDDKLDMPSWVCTAVGELNMQFTAPLRPQAQPLHQTQREFEVLDAPPPIFQMPHDTSLEQDIGVRFFRV